eukprot:PITA_06860
MAVHGDSNLRIGGAADHVRQQSQETIIKCETSLLYMWCLHEPSQSCCSGLSNVVKTNPVCLCQLFSGGNSVGVNINQTLAMAMPAACKITTPSISTCKVVGVPIPPISSPTAPKAPSTGSTGSGDKTKPTNTGSSPAGVSSAGTFAPTAIGLFLMGLIFSAIPL